MDPHLFGLLAFLLALLLLGAAFLLRGKRAIVRRIALILATVLLLYKSGEGIYFLTQGIYFIPYEVSHLAYWVVPILLLLGFSGSDYAAGALSFICGVGFLLGAIIDPSDLIANMTLYEEIRLFFTHELLFFLSLLLLFDFRSFAWKDYVVFVGMMLVFLLYLLLLRYRVLFAEDFTSRSIALQVMDGSLVNYLHPQAPLALRVGFAILCISLIFLVPSGLIFLGRLFFAWRTHKGIVQTEMVPYEERYGLLPLLARKRKGFRQE
jgi:hypothetical protein